MHTQSRPLTLLPRSRPRFAYSADGVVTDTYRNLSVIVGEIPDASQTALQAFFEPGTPVVDGRGRQGFLSSRGEFMPGSLFTCAR